MAKKLMKGNVAVVMGAILADCESFYGYPITPASEITETAAHLFPRLGRTFLQAESEVAAINMVYGAAATGVRTMTASSSPGISLKQEGISYAAGSELPMVVVDVMRGGPGLGNIGPEQADYFQMTKGGGHGNYRNIVLAPNCAQEMCDFTVLAFDLADKYRNPAVILTDGFIGQMMEPVELHPVEYEPVDKRSWAVDGTDATTNNLICSIHLSPEDLEKHNTKLLEKYRRVEGSEIRCEEYKTDDANVILIGYGVISRLLISVVDEARRQGMRWGLIRPITLWPFPAETIRKFIPQADRYFVVELSHGQLVEDVRLAVCGEKPIGFYYRCGGSVPSTEEVYEAIANGGNGRGGV